MSPRFRLFVCLAILSAGRAAAQTSTVPMLSKPLPAVTAVSGTGAITIDLREHFAVPGVTGQVAQIETTLGPFNVELLADSAPRTVANFLNYAGRGAYTNAVFHRLVAGFVIQTGAYTLQGNSLNQIATDPAIPNEYRLSNLRGTLAMAKLSGNPNSATSQWFINLADNSSNLDNQNGGFTVFARVLGTGMNIVDILARTTVYDVSSQLGGEFSTLPLMAPSLVAANVLLVRSIKTVPVFPAAAGDPAVLSVSASSANPAVAAAVVVGSMLSVSPIGAGTTMITVRATDTNDNSAAGTLTVTISPVAPAITLQPVGATVGVGGTLALAVGASGAPLNYQWRRNGVPVAGATNSTLIVENVTVSHAGSYDVVVSNSLGTATSTVAAVSVAAGQASRISNLSVRTNRGAGQTLTTGFVTNGPKPVLVRGVGPGMATVFPQFFSPADVMADPSLEFLNGENVRVDANEDWSGAALAATMTSVGAFPLTVGSKDAALVGVVNGPYTAQLKGTGTGVVLVDAYDTTDTYSSRLTNVSARNQVGAGAAMLIAGFVIDATDGRTAKTVLIRGIGAALRDIWGVSGVLADAKLEVFREGSKVAENDNWSVELLPIFDRVGAYRFVNGSTDAALLVTLPPGSYTAQVSGVGGTTGDGVVEVYEVP